MPITWLHQHQHQATRHAHSPTSFTKFGLASLSVLFGSGLAFYFWPASASVCLAAFSCGWSCAIYVRFTFLEFLWQTDAAAAELMLCLPQTRQNQRSHIHKEEEQRPPVDAQIWLSKHFRDEEKEVPCTRGSAAAMQTIDFQFWS